jgi:hypothetical protein
MLRSGSTHWHRIMIRALRLKPALARNVAHPFPIAERNKRSLRV